MQPPPSLSLGRDDASLATAVLTQELLGVLTAQCLELCEELRLSASVVGEVFDRRLVPQFQGGCAASERKCERLEKHHVKRTKGLEGSVENVSFLFI